MLDLTNFEKIRLLKIAKNLSMEELEKFHRAYIDTQVPITKLRVVQLYHKEFKHIIEVAKELNADFLLSKVEEKKLNQQLTKPITIIWEGIYQKTKPNERCLLNKTVPEIHSHINKLLSFYNERDRYFKAIAFIYNYLVQNGLEDKAININNIKANILKKKQKHTLVDNNYNQPKWSKKYLEQNVPF
jgi:hypothetical protein